MLPRWEPSTSGSRQDAKGPPRAAGKPCAGPRRPVDLETESTGDLVRKASKGDERAWPELMARFGPMIRRVAARVGLNATDVADAHQATWIRLMRRADQVREPERIGAWLATTAYRESQRIAIAGCRQVPSADPMADHARSEQPGKTRGGRAPRPVRTCSRAGPDAAARALPACPESCCHAMRCRVTTGRQGHGFICRQHRPDALPRARDASAGSGTAALPVLPVPTASNGQTLPAGTRHRLARPPTRGWREITAVFQYSTMYSRRSGRVLYAADEALLVVLLGELQGRLSVGGVVQPFHRYVAGIQLPPAGSQVAEGQVAWRIGDAVLVGQRRGRSSAHPVVDDVVGPVGSGVVRGR